MDKQAILDRVLAFCDVRGDTFNWRREPHRRELFKIFLDSHHGADASADEIYAYVSRYMDSVCRWNVPMQERVSDIRTTWIEWQYAVESYDRAYAEAH